MNNYEIENNSEIQLINFYKMKIFIMKNFITGFAYVDFFVKLLSCFKNIGDKYELINIYGYYNLTCSSLVLFCIIGINRYNIFISYLYAIYLFVDIVIIFSIIISLKIGLLFFALIHVKILIEFNIIKLIFKFVNNIKKIPEYDLYELKNGWYPNIFYSSIYE